MIVDLTRMTQLPIQKAAAQISSPVKTFPTTGAEEQADWPGACGVDAASV